MNESELKPKLDILRRFEKTYNDPKSPARKYFYEDYERFMWIALSPHVSAEDLERLVEKYDSVLPDGRLILPTVDKYGRVDLNKIDVFYEPLERIRELKGNKGMPLYPMGSSGERAIREEILFETNEALVEEEQENVIAETFLKFVDTPGSLSTNFYGYLVGKLTAEAKGAPVQKLGI